jgi:GTP-binding protein
VAFVGRSNVGKSSLLNRLLRRKGLARISSKPGRTRAANYFLIDDRLYFVDLPGYGFARAGRDERQDWARLTEEYFGREGYHGPAVQLVDGKVGATPLDVQAHEYLEHLGVATLVVATKIDRVPRNQRRARLAKIRDALALPEGTPLIPVSSKTGEGLPELWRELKLHLESRDA